MRALTSALVVPLVALSLACAETGGATAPGRAGSGTAPLEPDRNSVSAFAFMQADQLECYRKFLRTRPGQKGMTVVQFTILPDGGVDAVQVVENTVDDAESTACMVERVSRWKTPFRPAEPRVFRYPFFVSG